MKIAQTIKQFIKAISKRTHSFVHRKFTKEGASSKSKILCEVETKVERTFDASNFDEEDRDLAIALYSESPVPTREFQRIEANKKLLPSIEIEKEHLSSSLSVAEVANEKIARVLQAFEKIQGIEKRRNEEEAAKEKILYLERKKEIIQLEIDCLKLRFPQDDKFKHAIQGHLGPFFEVNFRPIQYCPNEKLEVFEEYFASLKQQCTTELQKKDAILQRIFNLQDELRDPTKNGQLTSPVFPNYYPNDCESGFQLEYHGIN